MKKKFNLYCGLLIVAIVFGVGLNMFKMGYQMYQGGKAGYNMAKKERQMGVNRDPMEGVRRIYKMAPVEMMPKGEYLMGLNSGDSIVNLKTGEKMPMMTVMGIVMPENGINRMGVLQGISYLNTALVIVFFVAFIKLVISVNKGRIFEKSTEIQLAWGGWSVFAMYLTGWVVELYNYFVNVQELDRKSTRLNSSHNVASRMPSSA